MNRRRFFALFAAAGVAALAPKAFEAATFITERSELEKLLGKWRDADRVPQVVLLPAEVFDEISRDLLATQRFVDAALQARCLVNLKIKGVTIIRMPGPLVID